MDIEKIRLSERSITPMAVASDAIYVAAGQILNMETKFMIKEIKDQEQIKNKNPEQTRDKNQEKIKDSNHLENKVVDKSINPADKKALMPDRKTLTMADKKIVNVVEPDATKVSYGSDIRNTPQAVDDKITLDADKGSDAKTSEKLVIPAEDK